MNGFPPPYAFFFLGEGNNGIALRFADSVSDNNVVKITYADKFPNEAPISLALNDLKPETQAFIHTSRSYERHGIEPSWKHLLPKTHQDGTTLIDWEKYDSKRLTYIFMEYAAYRIRYPNASAPGGCVTWVDLDAEAAKKVMFILLHALYVARRELQFSHNDIHDGQIMLFLRDPSKPIHLGNGYKIENCLYIPKLIDFGASVTGDTKEALFSDDVGQLVATFMKLHPQDDDLVESEAMGSSRRNFQVVKDLLDLDYFKEFRGGAEEVSSSAPICIGCMARATHIMEKNGFHVCGAKCASIY